MTKNIRMTASVPIGFHCMKKSTKQDVHSNHELAQITVIRHGVRGQRSGVRLDWNVIRCQLVLKACWLND